MKWENIAATLGSPRGHDEQATYIVQPASASSPESAALTSGSTGPGFDISRSVRATLTAATSSGHDGPESPSTATSVTLLRLSDANSWGDFVFEDAEQTGALQAGRWTGTEWAILTSSAEDSLAKICPSPDNGEDSTVTAPACSSSSLGSLSLFDPDGFSSRTYPVSSLHRAVGTSEQSLERWPTSGTAWPGGFSTHVSSECRSDEGGCSSSEPSLTMILEPPRNVPARYSLSARAARGILQRAQKRGRELPIHLKAALETMAAA